MEISKICVVIGRYLFQVWLFVCFSSPLHDFMWLKAHFSILSKKDDGSKDDGPYFTGSVSGQTVMCFPYPRCVPRCCSSLCFSLMLLPNNKNMVGTPIAVIGVMSLGHTSSIPELWKKQTSLLLSLTGPRNYWVTLPPLSCPWSIKHSDFVAKMGGYSLI